MHLELHVLKMPLHEGPDKIRGKDLKGTKLPLLVFEREIIRLKRRLAVLAEGRAFLLQASEARPAEEIVILEGPAGRVPDAPSQDTATE